MAFGLNLGDFGKSRAQIQKEREEYERSIFPFGESQKENVKTLISRINGKKTDQIDIMIAFIEAKQAYRKESDPVAVYRMILDKRIKLTTEQLKQVVSLVILDAGCSGSDDLPRMDQILEYSSSLVIER